MKRPTLLLTHSKARSQPVSPPYTAPQNQILGKDLPRKAVSSPSLEVSLKKAGEPTELYKRLRQSWFGALSRYFIHVY